MFVRLPTFYELFLIPNWGIAYIQFQRKVGWMKVFAQFHDVSPELGIRRNTVLQFGDSWETIGAVWLINPGSSSPV